MHNCSMTLQVTIDYMHVQLVINFFYNMQQRNYLDFVISITLT